MTAVEQLAEANTEKTKLQGELTESKRVATEAATNLTAMTARAEKAEGEVVTLKARAEKAEGEAATHKAKVDQLEKAKQTTDEAAREQNARNGITGAQQKSDANASAGEDIAAIAAKFTNPETSMSEKAAIRAKHGAALAAYAAQQARG